MQISDMLGQYSRNVTNGTEELKGASSMQKVVSTLGELSPGNVFEGTVSTARNGKVTLALSDGQTITARLDGKISLQSGTPMFFQVKSNDGTTVEIKPYTGAGSGGNPILMNALTAATIPVTERNLTMVNTMMQEQLPIDKQSVLDMVKIANMNPNVSVETAVRMTKLGIPVNDVMAAQFENYLTDEHAIMQEIDQAMNQLSEMAGSVELAPEEAVTMNQQMVDILLADADMQNTTALNEQVIPGELGGTQNDVNYADIAQGQSVTTTATENLLADGVTVEQGLQEQVMQTEAGADGQLTNPAANLMEQPLGQALTDEQLLNLNKLLQSVPTLVENQTLFPNAVAEDVFVDTMQDDKNAEKLLAQTEMPDDGESTAVLDKNLSVKDFLQAVAKGLESNKNFGFAGAQKLFGSEEYRTLLKNVMEQQWLIRPEELKSGDKINELYTRLERQMKLMEDVVKASGTTQNSFTSTAADVRGNIEFMNQLNQVYTYVQVPLRLAGQNANSELYVYTNKKNLSDPDAELSAFLHLDLEHLGSTDVSVKMLRKKVKTNFYMADDASYDLVEKYLPILEKKLKDKGYQCTITVSNEEKKMSFEEDFLRKDQPAAGILHRYSFDVRA